MNSNSLDDYYDDALYELMEPMEVVIPEEAFLEGENMIEVFVKGREDDASMSGSTSLTVTVTGGRSEAGKRNKGKGG